MNNPLIDQCFDADHRSTLANTLTIEHAEELQHPRGRKIYTLKAIATMFGYKDPGVLRQYIATGEVKATKFGRSWVMTSEDIDYSPKLQERLKRLAEKQRNFLFKKEGQA